MEILKKISILKIFRWIAKFTVKLVGYKILAELILRNVFRYKTLHFKIEKDYYTYHRYVEKGYNIYPLRYKEDFDIESYKENLKKFGFID